MPRRSLQPGAAAPFLKWAGGKTQLLPRILPELPSRIATYHEPFIGGGAVFFALAGERRFARAVLGDRNPELIEAYQVVRDDVEALIRALTRHQRHAGDEDYFYRLRARRPTGAVARVARTIFLNRTGFNGLYRLNRSGQFNVPFGRHRNPIVCNPPLLRAAARALAGVTLRVADFAELADAARPGDALYFDPPYVPVSRTAYFTAYDAFPFREPEHRRLAEAFRACAARGVAAVLSNSDCALTRELYRGLDVRTVMAARAINSVSSRRGPVAELLVVAKGR